MEEPAIQMLPAPTTTIAPAADSAREMETPAAKDGFEGETSVQTPPEQDVQPVPPSWQIVLAAVALLGGLIMLLMRQAAASRWRQN